jgi:hypothetical protein
MEKPQKNNKNYLILIITLAILIVGGFCVYKYYFAPEKGSEKSEQGVSFEEVLIKVETPSPNQEVTSPILIKGEARGSWFFEATFPIKLVDEKGEVISMSYAQAKGDWMSEGFVPFEAELSFNITDNKRANLILEKDNPSGLPENSAHLIIPIVLLKSQTESGDYRTVKLYYYNPELDKDESGNVLCSKNGLIPVERKIPVTSTPIQDTIKLLIAGELTQDERSQGITTEFPLDGFSLKEASLNNGILTLKFEDPNNKTIGGACRVGVLWFQIEETAKQFPGVQEVKFLPEDIFQP